ncbi:hypothetical protein E4T39_07152 [Aureobasidium subglaciale]|nr:hypothetical protein E4T39_07152 [Aureobasidium subglaciale]
MPEAVRVGLDSLPDELKAQILNHLTNPPPSWNWQKTTLDTSLTRSSALQEPPLKTTDKAAEWTATLDEQLARLFSFLDSSTNGSSCDGVQSLTLTATGELNDNNLDYIRDEVHCLIATDAFWNLLFEKIDPARVTILAPPSKLACLLGCSMNMRDAWAFPGMAMQLVSVWREPRPLEVVDPGRSMSESNYDVMQPVELVMDPDEYGRPAFSSMVYIRPWTHMAVNEGSFLEAYSTYEYFHKKPPGILAAVGRAFRLETNIWSVAYKAIFPFSNHISSPLDRITYKGNPSNVRKLYVKIAPDPEDTLLDDPKKIAKADITDCWREVESTYTFLTDPALRGELNFESSGTVRELEMFSFGDSSISSIRDTVTSSLESAGWQEVALSEWRSSRLVFLLQIPVSTERAALGETSDARTA